MKWVDRFRKPVSHVVRLYHVYTFVCCNCGAYWSESFKVNAYPWQATCPECKTQAAIKQR